jgi:MFS family permease
LAGIQWQAALAFFSGGILLCFALSVAAGVDWAVYLLPLSGLFMSVIYPTLNSKGISCLPKSEHGAGAGVILFFTCVSAVAAPLAIGAVGDAFGHIIYGFWLATGFAVLLFAGAVMNWLVNPTRGCWFNSRPLSTRRARLTTWPERGSPANRQLTGRHEATGIRRRRRSGPPDPARASMCRQTPHRV